MKPKLSNRIEQCKGFLCERCHGEGTCGSEPIPTKEEFNQLIKCVEYLLKEAD